MILKCIVEVKISAEILNSPRNTGLRITVCPKPVFHQYVDRQTCCMCEWATDTDTSCQLGRKYDHFEQSLLHKSLLPICVELYFH